MDIDFGVPQGPYTPPRPGSLTALKPALRPSLNRSPSQIPQPDGANPVVPQKRKKGRKTVVLDPVVGMSTEQIMHSREAYPTEMERLNGLARVSERTKREKDLASQLVFGVPLACECLFWPTLELCCAVLILRFGFYSEQSFPRGL